MLKRLVQKLSNLFYTTRFQWVSCFFLNLITLAILYYKIHPGNKTLALHYDVMVGVEWRGNGNNLYLIPTAAFLISAVNLVLYRAIKKNAEMLAPLTVFVSICVQLIALISVIFLATVNY